MSYLIGGLLSLSVVLIGYILIQKKNESDKNKLLKSIQEKDIEQQEATLIVFDRSMDSLEAKDFNDKYDALSYLSGKPNTRN